MSRKVADFPVASRILSDQVEEINAHIPSIKRLINAELRIPLKNGTEPHINRLAPRARTDINISIYPLLLVVGLRLSPPGIHLENARNTINIMVTKRKDTFFLFTHWILSFIFC